MPKYHPTDAPEYESEPMPANAWGKMRSELAQAGYSQAWINEQIGNNVGGRFTAEIREQLQAAMRTDEARRQRRLR